MDVGGAGRGLLAVWLFAASPACGGGGEGDGNEPSQMLAGAGAGTSGSAGAAGSMPMGMAGMSAGRVAPPTGGRSATAGSSGGSGGMIAAGGMGGAGMAAGMGGAAPQGGSAGTEMPPAGPCTWARGDAPTEASATAQGPYKVESYTSGFQAASGVTSSTVWHPTDADPPFAGIAVVPGYMSPESSIRQWGPFLAS